MSICNPLGYTDYGYIHAGDKTAQIEKEYMSITVIHSETKDCKFCIHMPLQLDMDDDVVEGVRGCVVRQK